MAYFKIGNTDFSMYVNKLQPKATTNYTAQTNAAGDTVVDYINTKRTIEVGIIPLDSVAMLNLLQAIRSFSVNISFLNPNTNTLEENIPCIIPEISPDFYTIQTGKVSYKELTLTFIEL